MAIVLFVARHVQKTRAGYERYTGRMADRRDLRIRQVRIEPFQIRSERLQVILTRTAQLVSVGNREDDQVGSDAGAQPMPFRDQELTGPESALCEESIGAQLC